MFPERLTLLTRTFWTTSLKTRSHSIICAYVMMSSLHHQSMFDSLSQKEFLSARQRSNPYETIRGAFFQNRSLSLSIFGVSDDVVISPLRAAMKMANIDAVTGFMFTNPRKNDGVIYLSPSLNPSLHPLSKCPGSTWSPGYSVFR